ncbi:hypothetical protein ACLB1S_08580 [Escherichia coli]
MAGMPEADIRRLIATPKNPDSLYAQSAH